ncbi:hypothetical protein FHX10_004554 [Rhizobium sp. BK591]|uniref:hypothetical protein n=1 Tax=Rhizobium sp. BK591 TaxID=2586985 RepID=UPI001620665E|nr:hypothetical protein [Rhizobium sp. BK591]MBB3745017.1 hypothetical protein [Rhizobium sp. BK591]
MTNLPVALSTLDQEITALAERLQPARPEFIAECLHSLKAGGMLVPKGVAAEDFLREYTIALGSVPRHGLIAVVTKLKRGEYPDISSEFMPVPAKLAHMARAECRLIVEDIARLRAKRNAIEEASKPPKVSVEENERQRVRIRELHREFKRQHQSGKAHIHG